MVDITRPIEPFELTQGFGENPSSYVRFGLKGHNGWDFKTKWPDTPKGNRYIMASWVVDFYKQGNEGNDGYGLFFETVCQLYSTWKLTYAHCASVEPFTRTTESQAMGVSDNTGNSTGAHLHLTVKRIKIVNGKHEVQDYGNGYFGAINPQEFFDELRKFKATGKDPKPVDGLLMQIEKELFEKLVTKSTTRDEIVKQLELPENSDTDKVLRSLRGIQGLVGSLQSDLAKANQEVANRIEQAERYKQSAEASATQLLAHQIASAENDKTKAKLIQEMQTRIKALEEQVDTIAKEKGTILRELAACKVSQTEAVENVLVRFFRWVWDAIKGVKFSWKT